MTADVVPLFPRDQGPDRLEVGTVFADRLHRLAREYDPKARHLSTLPTLGAVGLDELPVVVSVRVPADLAMLYRRGRMVAAFRLDDQLAPIS